MPTDLPERALHDVIDQDEWNNIIRAISRLEENKNFFVSKANCELDTDFILTLFAEDVAFLGFTGNPPNGMRISFIAPDNCVNAATLVLDATTSKSIYRNGAPVEVNDFLEDQLVELIYDGTHWAITNPAFGFVDNVVPDGDVNSVNDEYELPSTPIPAESLQVYADGAWTLDFTLVGKTLTMGTAPTTSISVFYRR